MNEFTAKKLGEVLAFTDVGLETWVKGRSLLGKTLGAERTASIIHNLKSQKDIIHNLSDRALVLKAVLDKMEKTGGKLRQMRDLYLDGKWDNPTEILEWFGFFEGAAIIHASFLRGAAEEIGHSELKSVADECFLFHRELFEEATALIHLNGRQKAR